MNSHLPLTDLWSTFWQVSSGRAPTHLPQETPEIVRVPRIKPGSQAWGGLTRHAPLTSWAVAVASGIANVTKYFDGVWWGATLCKTMPESVPNIRPPGIEPGTI